MTKNPIREISVNAQLTSNFLLSLRLISTTLNDRRSATTAE